MNLTNQQRCREAFDAWFLQKYGYRQERKTSPSWEAFQGAYHAQEERTQKLVEALEGLMPARGSLDWLVWGEAFDIAEGVLAAFKSTQPDYTCQYCRMGAPELCRCGKGHTQPEGEK